MLYDLEARVEKGKKIALEFVTYYLDVLYINLKMWI